MADISKEELRKEITAILKDANLNTMSAKNVRQQIELKLEVDLMDRKKEVDDLVLECLQEKKGKDGAKNSAKKRKGKDEDEEEEPEEEEEEEEPEEEEEEEEPKAKPKRGGGGGGGAGKKPVKRSKKGSDSESEEASEEDASDEEYSPSKKAKAGGGKRGGKGGGKKKKGSDSDSDEDWAKTRKTTGGGGGGGAKKGKGSGGGYTRAYTLSPELAAVVGQDSMPRHEVVKKVWAIIKERNLYDPKNKQFAICDDELLKVFGVKRFRTFGMMKYLKNHFID